MSLYFALYALLLQQALPHPVPTTKQTSTPAALVKMRLDTAKTTSFNVKFSAMRPVPNGEHDQLQLSFVADYAVQVQRPNLVRVLDLTSTWKSTHIPSKGGGMNFIPSQSYVSDGKKQLFWPIGPIGSTPAIVPFAAGEGELTTLEQTTGPDVFFPTVLFTPDALTRLKFKYYGEQVINGRTVAEYRSTAIDDTTVLYLNRKTRLPERVSTFKVYSDWTEIVRADFSDWKFDVTFPPDTFDLKRAAVTLKPYASRK